MQLIAGTHSQPSDKMGGHLPRILNLFRVWKSQWLSWEPIFIARQHTDAR